MEKTYTYNLMDQLADTRIWKGTEEKHNQQNYYDASGQRVRKTEDDASQTRYYYMGSEALYTTDDANNLKTENILGLGGDLIASRRPDAGSYNYFFYHQDVRGSTVNIADRNGNLAKGYEYDEFGNLTRQAGSFYNETTFTGSVTDSATGLQYMNARFYNPNIMLPRGETTRDKK